MKLPKRKIIIIACSIIVIATVAFSIAFSSMVISKKDVEIPYETSVLVKCDNAGVLYTRTEEDFQSTNLQKEYNGRMVTYINEKSLCFVDKKDSKKLYVQKLSPKIKTSFPLGEEIRGVFSSVNGAIILTENHSYEYNATNGKIAELPYCIPSDSVIYTCGSKIAYQVENSVIIRDGESEKTVKIGKAYTLRGFFDESHLALTKGKVFAVYVKILSKSIEKGASSKGYLIRTSKGLEDGFGVNPETNSAVIVSKGDGENITGYYIDFSEKHYKEIGINNDSIQTILFVN